MRIFFVFLFLVCNLYGDLPEWDSSFSSSLEKHLDFQRNENPYIAFLSIDDRESGIHQGTWYFIHQKTEEFKKNPPVCILLRLNTPGGEVLAAQRISDALKNLDLHYNIPTIAYIDSWAISAGAMIAYSCRYIVTVEDGSMGAAEPIFASPQGGMESAPEKINSALRSDFANRASLFGRNPLIAEAMVDKDLYLVEREGQIIALDDPKQARLEGSHPDKVISLHGKLLTLTATEMFNLKVANAVIAPQPPFIFGENDSLAVKDTFLSTFPVFSEHQEVSIIPSNPTWKDRFFLFLSNPAVSSILMMVVMVGFYIEFTTPGFGIFGSAAVIALTFVLLSSFSLEIGSFLEILFLSLGILFIVVDWLWIPTFGLFTFLGFFLMVAGFLGLFIPGFTSIPAAPENISALGSEILERLGWMGLSLTLSLGIIALITPFLQKKARAFPSLVLPTPERENIISPLENLVGKTGVVVSDVRPYGKIRVEGNLYDAENRFQWIEKGRTCKVIGIKDRSLLIEPL